MSLEVLQQIQEKALKAKNLGLNTLPMETNKPSPVAGQAKSSISPREIGQTHYKLAKIYFDKADFEKAEYYFLKALDVCELPEDAFAMMKITGFLIRIYSEFLRKEEAKNYISVSQILLENIFADSSWQARAEYFFYLGATKTYLGEFQQAIDNFSLAYKKAQESNEPEVVAKSLLFIAQNYYQMDQCEEAIKVLRQLEQLLSILNKGYLKGSMYLLYGNIYNQMGDYKKAITFFKKASEDLTKKVCWNLFGYIMLGIGRSHKKMGDYKKALTFFELAKTHNNAQYFKKLHEKINLEIEEVNDSNIDFVIDKTERIIKEKNLGVIDFKHRFVLLEILYLLASNPGKYFDKEDLSRDIWREEYNPLIHDKLIYTSISRLRKLIEPGVGEKSKYIIRGKDGYTFSPHVKVRFCQHAHSSKDSIGNVEISSPI
ncbi:MAG: tetratricopeptide repeat protein [Halobacteriovoraceae bacterium]|nr:tetratricopeptide repeat protein [Halobacteriovoraceae bacterium]MCB9095713.1 tetratricopeptide repeat protein [Halobacteriovoraceae bacterium]